ncbi:uncharacterized protein LOC132400697 isoform X2 [Hypanus sabinus]|uniref:uncharacterized protein LOC132400697 isoform X2 n=1 Tax=Hypanus sabinus TaxID=79690 RepID=UPI0028C4FBDB|nr:uncharacterized protein LOC132400697 isoform X2 [Hypanus sabinus]
MSTTKKQSRKCSTEEQTNGSPPKRKRNLLLTCTSAHSASSGSTYRIMRKPVSCRMNTGHFSAWGVEDGHILYYMQKTSDSPSGGSAITSTPWQRASKSPQSHQNSSKNCAKQKNKNIISSNKMIQTKKKPKPCSRWTTADSKNPKEMFYFHFSKRLINMPEVRFPGGPDDCDGNNDPNSLDTWTCDTCLLLNKDPAIRCRGCETLKYGIGLKRQWIPANDMSTDPGCKKIQMDELSTDTCTVAGPQITDGAEDPTPCNSLMTDDICPHPQVAYSDNTSDVNTEEQKTMETLPARAILPPAQINHGGCLPFAFTGTGKNNLSEVTSSPPKPTQQAVPSGSGEQQKCEKGEDESKRNGLFSFQASLTCITFPYVFGSPPIYTTCSSAVPLTLNVTALTRTSLSSVIVPSPPFQTLPFLPRSSNEMSTSNRSSVMSNSCNTFPSSFRQTSSELFPDNTEGANSGITVNPLFPSTGPGFPFSGSLVPNCNFGCSANNAVFRFEANSTNQSISRDVVTEAPTMLNSLQARGISHRKFIVAARKRRPYRNSGPSIGGGPIKFQDNIQHSGPRNPETSAVYKSNYRCNTHKNLSIPLMKLALMKLIICQIQILCKGIPSWHDKT